MAIGRWIGFGLLGAIGGAAIGGGAGVLASLAYAYFVTVAGVETYSNSVAASWMLGGIGLGILAGIGGALRAGR